MSDDHASIEELLAGYALDSLTGADAAEMDQLLDEHVPGCLTCRRTLDAFGTVVGDLALAAEPLTPPDTLLPSLRRDLEPRVRRLGPVRLVAVAASVLLVVGLGGVALTLSGDGSGPITQLSAQDLQQALSLAQRDDATTRDLGPATEVSAEGVDHFYLYGYEVPAPPAGQIYRLWLVSGAASRYLGQFVPEPGGEVVLRVEADPAGWERVLVTVEPAGTEPSEPGQPAWEAAG